jgi:hypothetical protein
LLSKIEQFLHTINQMLVCQQSPNLCC